MHIMQQIFILATKRKAVPRIANNSPKQDLRILLNGFKLKMIINFH